MHYFGLPVTHSVNGETYGMFHSVEIIVEAGACEQEEGCRNTAELEATCQCGLECILHHFDCYFGGFGQ